MMRTRLLWFTIGIAVSGAGISQLVVRDLFADRCALSSDMKHKFDALEQRVLNLEAGPFRDSNSSGIEA